MCLAIPGKVIEKYSDAGLDMGKIDFNGSISEVCLAYVPEVEIGQYVYIHAGFAISILDEKEAEEVFATWRDFAERLEDQPNPINYIGKEPPKET
jgi:hydrogenase expression/formation protein HypC